MTRPGRRQLERLAIELSAAIRNEARGQSASAAFYWRRARRVTSDVDIQSWCLARASAAKAETDRTEGSGGRDGA